MRGTERSLALVTLALATGLGACTAAPPAMPSYATDVQPIFMAHCTRCHSANGPDGGFSGDPAKTGYNSGLPAWCHLDHYDDVGDCTLDGGLPPPGCRLGAHTCAMLFKVTLLGYIQNGTMPPPPAPKLNDWELDVVERWVANPIP